MARGLDFNASFTYTNSVIKENAGFVVTPGDTLRKWQPNIAEWRATALAARYSGVQYRTLNNADANGFTYQGMCQFFTTDPRVVWKVNQTVTAGLGIDNVNNYRCWNFHPYPQRSYHATLKADF